MLKSKTYVRLLSLILFSIFAGTFIYTYIYSKHYPIPLTHRVSLDAKLMFIRDMPNKEDIDTLIIGSSIGLNNVQGAVLEASSKRIKHVLNLSSFSVEVSHIEKIWELILLFPNVKRIIYSAQSLDFSGESNFEAFDMNLAKEYTYLGRHGTNLTYAFYAYKNFIQCVTRQSEWKEKYMTHRKFSNLDFDYTGSAPLHIYGSDIVKKRWDNPYVVTPTDESYLALGEIMKKAKKRGMLFYFVIQPYRGPLVKKDTFLRSLLIEFDNKTKKIVLENSGYFINLHNKLNLTDEYFADRIHLNDKGSIITSKTIGKFIDTHEQ